MDSQVSLSTVLLLLFAAFGMYRVFQWRYSAKKQNRDGYEELIDRERTYYRKHRSDL